MKKKRVLTQYELDDKAMEVRSRQRTYEQFQKDINDQSDFFKDYNEEELKDVTARRNVLMATREEKLEEELITAHEKHSLWLKSGGEEGERASFSGRDLSRIRIWEFDFRYADFSNVDFKFSSINECNFMGADFRGTKFHGAIITNTDFRCADISWAKFPGVSFSFVKFKGVLAGCSEFIYANLRETDLRRTDLRGAKLVSVTFADNEYIGLDDATVDNSNMREMSREELLQQYEDKKEYDDSCRDDYDD